MDMQQRSWGLSPSPLSLSIFWCGSFLKSLFGLLHRCFCFMLWLFGQEACRIPTPQIGETEPLSPMLEGVVQTTEPPEGGLSLPRKSSLHICVTVSHGRNHQQTSWLCEEGPLVQWERPIWESFLEAVTLELILEGQVWITLIYSIRE